MNSRSNSPPDASPAGARRQSPAHAAAPALEALDFESPQAKFVLAALRLPGAQRAGALQAARALGISLERGPYHLLLASPPDDAPLQGRLAALADAGVDLAANFGPCGVSFLALACIARSKPAVHALLDAGADPFAEFSPEKLPPTGKLGLNDPNAGNLPPAGQEALTFEERELSRWRSAGGARLDALACAAMAGFSHFFEALKERGLWETAPKTSLDRAAAFAAGGFWANVELRDGGRCLNALAESGADFTRAAATLPWLDREPLRTRIDHDLLAPASPVARLWLGAVRSPAAFSLTLPLISRHADEWAGAENDRMGKSPIERLFDSQGLRDFERNSFSTQLFVFLRERGLFQPGQPMGESALRAAFLCALRNPKSPNQFEEAPLASLSLGWAQAGARLSDETSAYALRRLGDFLSLALARSRGLGGALHAPRTPHPLDPAKDDSTQELRLGPSLDARQVFLWACSVGESLLPALSAKSGAALMGALGEASSALVSQAPAMTPEAAAQLEALSLSLSLQADRLAAQASASPESSAVLSGAPSLPARRL